MKCLVTVQILIHLTCVCRQERANIALQPITRTSTGKLPTTRTPVSASQSGDNGAASTSGSGGGHKVLVSSKATPEEIKEKMEQQLRIQRAAHHQKRALEMKNGKLHWTGWLCTVHCCVCKM